MAADFVAPVPRRARLKRRQTDVLGVSYEEQRLIEKALKESLKDKQSQIDSDDDSDMSCHSDHLVLGNKNVAKKSATNDKPWMESKATRLKLQSKQRHRPLKNCKDDSQGDPVYKPHATGCASNLPPKPSFERHSKAITNFMLDMSTETDDDDSLLTTFSSESRTVTQPPYFSEEDKVIVISDSSADNEDTSDDDSSSCSSSSSCSLNLDSKFQSKSNALLGKVVSPANGAFKTQKILFKAVKKSSSKAPVAVFSPRDSTALIVSPKPANLATRKQPSKFARPKAMFKKSPARDKTKPQPISYCPKNSLSSSVMLESDISSLTSSDESEDYSQVTLSKDTDKSLFLAQRKFAGYMNPSNQCNHLQSYLADTETTCNIPSTEDFILFLCLRNSGRMPESLHTFNTPIHPRVTKQRTSGICIQ